MHDTVIYLRTFVCRKVGKASKILVTVTSMFDTLKKIFTPFQFTYNIFYNKKIFNMLTCELTPSKISIKKKRIDQIGAPTKVVTLK